MKARQLTADEYNKKLDELALEAMKCILGGADRSPIVLSMLFDAGQARQISATAEVTERSYEMAAMMLKYRKQYLMTDDGTSNNHKQ